jgi:hypothetical protein
MSGAVHAPCVSLAMNRVCCWRNVAGTDNADLPELCSVLVRVYIVLCIGMGALKSRKEVQRVGENVDALRRPLETCLVDNDILTKVFIDDLKTFSFLSSPLYHGYIKSWSFHPFVREAPKPTRSNLDLPSSSLLTPVVVRHDVTASTHP